MIVLTVALAECVYLGRFCALGPWSEVAWGAALSCLAGLIGVMIVGLRLKRQLCRTDDGPSEAGIPLFWLLILPVVVPFLLMLALIPAPGDGQQLRYWPSVPSSSRSTSAAAGSSSYGGSARFGPPRPGWRRSSSRPPLVPAPAHARRSSWPRPTPTQWRSPFQCSWSTPPPILDRLDDDEVVAITAHELGHLAEPQAAYLARVAVSSLTEVAVAGIPLGGSFGLWAGLTPPVLLAGMVVMQRVGRRMEERSDSLSREHEGVSQEVYSRALEKLYKANLTPVVLRGRRHVPPHLYDRLIASGTTPDYPRPAPPPA